MKRSIPHLLWLALLVLHAAVSLGQQTSTEIKGKVTSSGGTPLSNVIIRLDGTNRTFTSSDSGIFAVAVPNLPVTLKFSFVGYISKDVAVTDAGFLDVVLADSLAKLEDVVVVGYGTQRKSNITGSISVVKASDLVGAPVMRVEQSLQGRTSGLSIAASSGQPGSGSTVRVRGVTSINNSDPLYVVDGIQIDGGIDYLNQSDIESISVLKDGASAAIYGSRAANGVILVTTKQGRVGTMHVTYNGYYGLQRTSNKLHLLDATQYATLRNEAYVNDGKAPLFADPSSFGKGTDWQSLIFDNHAPIQDHEISISGGSEKSTYYTSFGYYDQKGIVAPDISWYKRFTMRLNTSFKLAKWITFGENFSYSYIKNQGIGNTNSEFGGPLSSAINLDPITPAIVTDPDMLTQAPYASILASNPDAVVRDANGNVYGLSSYVQNEMTNPLAYIKTQIGNYSWSHNMVGNAYLEVRPIEGLTLKSTINAKLAFYGSRSFTPLYYLSPTQSNLSTDNMYRETNNTFLWSWENTAAYAYKHEDHSVSLLVGTSSQQLSGDGLNVNFIGLPVTSYDQASANFSLTAANRIGAGWDNQPYTLVSYFSRLNYDYAGKYLLTAIVRRDGSSKFGSNNRFGTFPSVSLGWVPTKESFWPQNTPISFLKIRGSLGTVGNEMSLGYFNFISTVSGGADYPYSGDGTINIGYHPNAPANPDLKWEQTKQTDIGFDMNFFSHFNLTFDWYKKVTSKMLLQVQVPGYLGSYGNPYGNIASLQNTGYEIDLGYNNHIGDFNFRVNGNASYVKNKITDLGENSFLTAGSLQASSYEIARTTVGQPIGSFYGFETMGIFQTQQDVDNYQSSTGSVIQPDAKPGDFKWADINGDGVINDQDRTYLGQPIPTWTYGLTITADYKNFDIVLFGQGAGGNKVFQALRRLDLASANYSTAALGRWTGAGTSNDYPRMTDNDPNHNYSNPSSFYLSKGDYFRVKNVQLGYTFSQGLLKKAGIGKIRVYVSGNNLFTFTKYAGFDPEIGGGTGSFGIDRGVYPQAKSYILGASINF